MSPLILDYGNHAHRCKRGSKTANFEVAAAAQEDVRRLVDIEFHAFENERTNHILSYRDYKKPAHFERAVTIYSDALSSDSCAVQPKASNRRRSDSKVEPPKPVHHLSLLKVTDLESEEIVSFTKAETMAYTIEELLRSADVGHDGEAKMNRDWFALNEQVRRDYMGFDRHCCKFPLAVSLFLVASLLTRPFTDIGMLATRPCYQHNGAGTMLLDAILAEADQAGLKVYLEATDTAKPLYERHGFKALRELRFDPGAYGVRGYRTERQTVMVRGALGDDGRREEVRDWEAAAERTQTRMSRILR